jgi:hypothetical protein
VPPPNPLVAKVEAEWAEVTQGASKNDFNAWTNLIATAEKLVSGSGGPIVSHYRSWSAPPWGPLCGRSSTSHAILMPGVQRCGAIMHPRSIPSMHAQDDLEKLRMVYDQFLASWPLCYGYWKKYAEAEHRHGHVELAVAVYERGVAATPSSIDMWVHYLNYQKTGEDTAPDTMRRCVLGKGGGSYMRSSQHACMHVRMKAPLTS